MRIYIIILYYYTVINFIYAGHEQRRLLKYLLVDRQYDVLERPVRNDSETLSVSINLALQQIIEFDGKNEVIIISGWVVLMWNDYNLVWKPEEYGQIETLRIPSTKIWTPDILLYNSADEKFDSTMKVNAVVQHNGDVLYAPPGIFKSICPFDIAAFPFDTQTCTLKFGSWTFDDSGVNLTAENNKGQLDAYIKSAEWDLEDFSASSNASKYDCCPTSYPYVLFTIRMRRRSLYYFTNIVVPCFLISCMTLVGFLVAPDTGEKVTLQITILLSVIMFSLIMSDIMPPSSTAIPIITLYFLSVMIMSAISVVASVIVISLHFRNPKNYTLPRWVQKYICCYLAWLLRMKRPRHDLTWNGIRRRWATYPIAQQAANNNIHRQKLLSTSFYDYKTIHWDNQQLYDFDSIRLQLTAIVNHLAALTQHQQEEEEYDDETQDWKFVAMVIDRLCLIIFTLSMILFTFLTLFRHTNFLKLQ